MAISYFNLAMLAAGAYLLCVVSGSYREGLAIIGVLLACGLLVHGF